jgi:hypothetical protein
VVTYPPPLAALKALYDPLYAITTNYHARLMIDAHCEGVGIITFAHRRRFETARTLGRLGGDFVRLPAPSDGIMF